MLILVNVSELQGKIGEGGHPASWVSTSHFPYSHLRCSTEKSCSPRVTAAAVLMPRQSQISKVRCLDERQRNKTK